MSFQDTKERIFRNGQIYSRPRFGGSVHDGPDNRPFTPDPNPYDVPPEPRGYGQGSVDLPDYRDFLYRPGVDKFEIENPVYRPGVDDSEVVPLTPETGKREFLYQYLQQNQELMGPKNQMFERYADPDDGTLVSVELPAFNNNLDDGQRLREAIRSGDIDRIIPGFTERRLEFRRKYAPLLRGV